MKFSQARTGPAHVREPAGHPLLPGRPEACSQVTRPAFASRDSAATAIRSCSTRVTNEAPEVNRVVLYVTSKPPATIEWE